MRIIVKDKNEILFDTQDDETYTFDLDAMKIYDWYEESVRCVLGLGLDGPATARLIYLLSYRFLHDNNLPFELTSEDLR